MFIKGGDHQLNNLREGFSFTHNKTVWTIVEKGEYHWNNAGQVIHYLVKSPEGIDASIEHEMYQGKALLSFSQAEPMSAADIEQAIEEEFIVFDGKEFELDETLKGSYKNLTNSTDREDLVCYYFLHDSEFVSIEKWADGSFDVYVGYEFEEKGISKIKTNEKL